MQRLQMIRKLPQYLPVKRLRLHQPPRLMMLNREVERFLCRHRRTYNAASASATAFTGVSQSPNVGCLNSRIVGYHAHFSPSIPHRQSGACLSSTHAGPPSAPAKCAVDVSIVITKSISAISAAVSENDRICCPIEIQFIPSAGAPAPASTPICKLTKSTFFPPPSAANFSTGIDRN